MPWIELDGAVNVRDLGGLVTDDGGRTVGGRLLRCIRGDLRAGFVWDGRDAQGRLVPAGVYLHRVVARGLVLRGRSYLVR